MPLAVFPAHCNRRTYGEWVAETGDRDLHYFACSARRRVTPERCPGPPRPVGLARGLRHWCADGFRESRRRGMGRRIRR